MSEPMPVSDSGPVEATITARSKTTLGAIVTVVGLVLGAVGYMENMKANQAASFNKLDRRLEKLEETTQRYMEDRWTSADMRLWAVKLGSANRELTIPDPE